MVIFLGEKRNIAILRYRDRLAAGKKKRRCGVRSGEDHPSINGERIIIRLRREQWSLEKYSMGVGDRFGFQGAAQLQALQRAASQGVTVIPVWNKSNREHSIIGTKPEDTRREADAAVQQTGWKQPYHVDADHIGIANVDKFIPSCDFFTLDVADFIGKLPAASDLERFARACEQFKGNLRIPLTSKEFPVTDETIRVIGTKYLYAVKEAANTYRHIKKYKTNGDFIVEVSMDETDVPQTPVELFFILFAVAQEEIPIQTIAPKFSGKFLKGIDYVGDVHAFAREFEEDLLVISHAVNVFSLPQESEIKRPLGERQVFVVSDYASGYKKISGGTSPQDGRYNVAGRTDRVGSRRR